MSLRFFAFRAIIALPHEARLFQQPGAEPLLPMENGDVIAGPTWIEQVIG
jgi:hypothetical protein